MTPRHILLFLAIAFGWSWAFWALPASSHAGLSLPAALPGWLGSGAPAAWGPFVGAVVVALVRGGPIALLALFKRFRIARIGWRWALVVVLTFPLLIGGATAFALLTGAALPPSEALRQPVQIPFAFVYILLLGGPLQEELGWRGTLLDPLQARLGALAASIVVGAVWAAWHLPLFAFPNDIGPYYGRPFAGTLLTLVLVSVLFTWVWNNTGGSLLAVMVFHAMFNLSHWVFPALADDRAALALFALQGAAVLGVVVAFGPVRLRRGQGAGPDAGNAARSRAKSC